jgi:hypothetical protein
MLPSGNWRPAIECSKHSAPTVCRPIRDDHVLKREGGRQVHRPGRGRSFAPRTLRAILFQAGSPSTSFGHPCSSPPVPPCLPAGRRGACCRDEIDPGGHPVGQGVATTARGARAASRPDLKPDGLSRSGRAVRRTRRAAATRTSGVPAPARRTGSAHDGIRARIGPEVPATCRTPGALFGPGFHPPGGELVLSSKQRSGPVCSFQQLLYFMNDRFAQACPTI